MDTAARAVVHIIFSLFTNGSEVLLLTLTTDEHGRRTDGHGVRRSTTTRVLDVDVDTRPSVQSHHGSLLTRTSAPIQRHMSQTHSVITVLPRAGARVS